MARSYPLKRNLDGVRFRVLRDGRYEPVCFTDLTDAEKDEVLNGKSRLFLCQLCRELAGRLREIGDEHDLEVVRE